MNSILVKNCGQLLSMGELGTLRDAYVLCDGDRIKEIGEMADLPEFSGDVEVVDAEGQVVMPALVECHTHSVFAGSRAEEFKQKLEGKSYLDILRDGGGILTTVKATRAASKEELFESTMKHLDEFMTYGVATVEIKTGYGLSVEAELKLLDVIDEVKKVHPVNVFATFMAAHTVPPEYKGRAGEYIDLIIDEMLPALQGRADAFDVFCEKGAFNLEESRRLLEAAKKAGLKLKLHAEQINDFGGSKMAAELGAISVDHLDHLGPDDIKIVAESDTVGVLLPMVPLYTREDKYADGRRMIDAGMKVAVSTDFNPGSCPSKNIFLAMNLACLKMGLTVEEVLKAVTINAAIALGMEKEIGSLEVGKRADITIMKVKSCEEIPYTFAENLITGLVLGGKLVLRRQDKQ
jgi:imidazolonepropionase